MLKKIKDFNYLIFNFSTTLSQYIHDILVPVIVIKLCKVFTVGKLRGLYKIRLREHECNTKVDRLTLITS